MTSNQSAVLPSIVAVLAVPWIAESVFYIQFSWPNLQDSGHEHVDNGSVKEVAHAGCCVPLF